MEIDESKNIITSALKIFNVLELIIELEKVSLTEISIKTNYTKSTCQRILNTLKYLNYIDQDPLTYLYYPSIKIQQLANNITINNLLKEKSRSHIENMAKEINETINLGALNGDNIIYLDKVLSKSPLRVDIDSNLNIPLYCSALGKSIAAYNKINYSFKNKYKAFTKNTITSDSALQKELKNVYQQGYAMDNEEFVEGLICIGVPILNNNNEAIASLSVSIPKSRYDQNNLNFYLDLLKKYTKKISYDLFQ